MFGLRKLSTVLSNEAVAPSDIKPAKEDTSTLSLSSSMPISIPSECSICNSPFNGPRSFDGVEERPYITPCGHIFGHACILRWLQFDSPNRDCPACRRQLVYRDCGHLILPAEVDKAPGRIEVKDMPTLCKACREGRGQCRPSRAWERMEKEKSVLLGLKGLLPGLFGGVMILGVESVDERIEEAERRYWRNVTLEYETREEW
ncbi:hypothetical protein F5884DRAFT_88979 [Xylogone sp. PMI_703]|nr:hypothetical protein F5884DRAFT_88979 [Xylogone sp. PMI_703]